MSCYRVGHKEIFQIDITIERTCLLHNFLLSLINICGKHPVSTEDSGGVKHLYFYASKFLKIDHHYHLQYIFEKSIIQITMR